MSGFAGIIHLDGTQVDKKVLEQMTRLAERHGSGKYNTRCDSNTGFGYSLLRNTPESAHERQPFSFDQNLWIVGDVRVDERESLVAKLLKEGRQASLSRPDIELVLHAFHIWKECCIEQLIGDFAFAIWDKERSSLFCARDSFGVKPFYYANTASTLIFSNDLDSVRAYPGISNELNEAAIGDYLAFGYNLDEQATFFKEINRLPPAHTLTVQDGKTARERQYQKLSCSHRIRYRKPEDYFEHFYELFRQAVSDRLRTNEVSFELSGGLDSTSVASMAALIGGSIAGFSAKGVTTDNSRQNPDDQEACLAAMVAERCGFEHATVEAAGKEDWYSYCGTAQPFPSPFIALSQRYADPIRQHGNVMLTGQGGDPFFHGSGHPLLDRFRESSIVDFAMSTMKLALSQKSLRGLGLRSLWVKDSPRIKLPNIPPWLRREFVVRAGSVERWKNLYYRPDRYPPGCQVEMAWDELHMPVWTHLFEDYYHDLFSGIDCRHPLFDVRLVNFLFAIPKSIKQDKKLLRLSMKNMLPEPVLSRSKSVVFSDKVQFILSEEITCKKLDFSLEHQADWISNELYQLALERYVKGESSDKYTMLAPINLKMWVRCKL